MYEMDEEKEEEKEGEEKEREKKIAGKKWRMQKGRKITEVGASVEGEEDGRGKGEGANSV